MKLSFLIVFIALFLPGIMHSQQPELQWQKCFGGDTLDQALSIVASADSHFVFVGTAHSTNGDVIGNHRARSGDVWVVKIDRSGALVWQRCLGNVSNEGGVDIAATRDGGFVVVGVSSVNGGDVSGIHSESHDIWFVKLTSAGVIAWQKCLGGSSVDIPSAVIQTLDNGYLVTGRTQSTDGDVSGKKEDMDGWVVKLDSAGSIEWQHCLGEDYQDGILDVVQTLDSQYVVVGYDLSVINYLRPWVAAFTSTGGLQWKKYLADEIEARSIVSTNDGKFALAGLYKGQGWLAKLTTDGDMEWEKMFGGSYSDAVYSLIQTAAGDFLLAGESPSGFGARDGWIVGLDSNGNIKWQGFYGGEASDLFTSVIQTAPGEYLLAGYTWSPGITPEYHGKGDAWIVKLGGTLGVENDRAASLAMTCVPNPAKANTVVSYALQNLGKNATISVSDVNGVRLIQYDLQSVGAGHHETTLDLRGFSSGSYFITLTVDELSKTCPLQIIK